MAFSYDKGSASAVQIAPTSNDQGEDPGEWGTWLKGSNGSLRAIWVWQGGSRDTWNDWTSWTARIIANGGSGNDVMLGGRNSDQLSGNDGDDVIFGGDGNDTMSGGDGNDTLVSFAYSQSFYDLGAEGRKLMAETANSGEREWLFGGNGQDILVDGALNGFLKGGDGRDTIVAGGGSDFVDGGEGDDVIYGGSGNDRLYGGSGNDWIEANGSGAPRNGFDADALYGGSGADTLVADGWGKVLLMGEWGDDKIVVSGLYNATVDGGSGDDFIDATTAQFGGDFDGGVGSDTIYGTAQADIADGGDGSDKLQLGDGGDFAVRFARESGSDTYSGGSGYDTLIVDLTGSNAGWSGLSSILDQFNKAGSDGISGSYAGVTFDGFEQIIVLSNNMVVGAAGYALPGSAGPITAGLPPGFTPPDDGYNSISIKRIGDGNTNVSGAGSDDIIIASSLDDGSVLPADFKIYGGDGNDTLIGIDRNDWLKGEAGNDYLFGGTGADTLVGGGGNDTLDGGSGSDVLDADTSQADMDGGEGADTLYGANLSDTLDGGDGDDTIYTFWGDDNVSGGNGNDKIDASDKGGTKTLDGGNGSDSIWGGNGDELISGGTGSDDLWGYGGNDFMTGGSWNDTLRGGEGNDTLSGDAGSDVLYGGGGNDVFVFGRDAIWQRGTYAAFSGNGKTYYVDLGAGQYGRSLDSFNGESGRDTLVGTEGRDGIFAVTQQDGPKNMYGIERVSAGGGSDVVDLSSYYADDGGGVEIYGGAGDDVLIGSVSDDLIVGGNGNDTMAGNGGNNRFVFAFDIGNTLDGTYQPGQCDQIVDFHRGDSLWVTASANIATEFVTMYTGSQYLARAGAFATVTDTSDGALVTFGTQTSNWSVLVAGVTKQNLNDWGAL